MDCIWCCSNFGTEDGTLGDVIEGALDGKRKGSNHDTEDETADGAKLKDDSEEVVVDGFFNIKDDKIVTNGDKLVFNVFLFESTMIGKTLWISFESSDGKKEGIDDTVIEGILDDI